ncbi:hypothetical protein DL93DRAFT_2151545 [Clavulina sp. PMI_390]|nr:hypothetical protein DL93DRAFT_2151545 [Clavulina sp. PMI_390]
MNNCIHVRSLYRSLQREAGRIKYEYPSFRTQFDVANATLVRNKIRNRSRELRRLKNANAGRLDDVRWMLEMAYARRGKLRSEILSNVANDPHTPHQAPIISKDPIKSRPPKMPSALATLLTYAPARKTKALSTQAVLNPPKLPPRADPSSSEARLLGPFSLRREKNIRRRFFREESDRTLPPLALSASTGPQSPGQKSQSTSEVTVRSAKLYPIGFEGSSLLEELGRLAIQPKGPTPRRAQQQKASADSTNLPTASIPQTNPSPQAHPTRFMRRRFGELLAQIPILSAPSDQDHETKRTKPSIFTSWNASIPKHALLKAKGFGNAAPSQMSQSDQDWVLKSGSLAQHPKKKQR